MSRVPLITIRLTLNLLSVIKCIVIFKFPLIIMSDSIRCSAPPTYLRRKRSHSDPENREVEKKPKLNQKTKNLDTSRSSEDLSIYSGSSGLLVSILLKVVNRLSNS
ncbi:unnamed protein product, partial [Cyprideis torosa]